MSNAADELLLTGLSIDDRARLARRLLLALHDDERAVDALAVSWFETPAPSDRERARITWWLSEVAQVLDLPAGGRRLVTPVDSADPADPAGPAGGPTGD